MRVCASASVLAHLHPFFNKRLFNTHVTLGTVQLKSNTLQESITCCFTDSEQSSNGQQRRGEGLYLKSTATKQWKIWSQRLHCWQMWTSFWSIERQLLWKLLSFQLHRDPKDIHTDGNSSEGNQAVHYQTQWYMDGVTGRHWKRLK